MRPWFSPSTVTNRARLPCGGMAVDDLAGQDGFARAGRALDHVEAAPQEAAAQDRVEARHEAGNPLDLAVASAGVGLKLRHASSGPGLAVKGEA